jgi:hypothetical protein
MKRLELLLPPCFGQYRWGIGIMGIISLYKSGKCDQIINNLIEELLFYALGQLYSQLEILVLSTPIVAFGFIVLIDALQDFLLLIWVTESLVELSHSHEG